jgi:dihydroorotase
MITLLKNGIINGKITDIVIEDDIILSVGAKCDKYEQCIDLGGKIIFPGMIDAHVHVRDLKQAYKEDWLSVSNAAISGGVTTIFDMPNTIPPTIDLDSLYLKRNAAKKAKINRGYYLGIAEDSWANLDKLLKSEPKDVVGIKIFLAESSTNAIIERKEDLRKIFSIVKEHDVPVAVHTELQSCIDKSNLEATLSNHDLIRARECTIQGTKLVLTLCNEIKNKLYIAHVSTKEELDLIRAFKDDNEIYSEVTPHHLFLDKTILDEVGNFGKVNPPLRTQADNEALWRGIIDGSVDTIGSDHAPHTVEEKKRPYQQAPSGFPGLETTMPLLIDAYLKGTIAYEKVAELTAANPAHIFGASKRGRIAAGYYADLIIIDRDSNGKVEPQKFKSKAKYSPFQNRILKGKIVMTIVNGKIYNLVGVENNDQ